MNRERINQLIDHLEALRPEEFNMNEFFDECGTPGCMAGHAIMMFDYSALGLYENVASKLLGIGFVEGKALFLPEPHGMYDPYSATAKQAAHVLRHFRDTRQVEWRKMLEIKS